MRPNQDDEWKAAVMFQHLKSFYYDEMTGVYIRIVESDEMFLYHGE